MSRSRKKNPGHTWCGRSQKKGKRFSNRRFRRSEHLSLSMGDFLSLPLRTRELTSQYDLGGDGKGFFCPHRKTRFMLLIENVEQVYRKILRK